MLSNNDINMKNSSIIGIYPDPFSKEGNFMAYSSNKIVQVGIRDLFSSLP